MVRFCNEREKCNCYSHRQSCLSGLEVLRRKRSPPVPLSPCLPAIVKVAWSKLMIIKTRMIKMIKILKSTPVKMRERCMFLRVRLQSGFRTDTHWVPDDQLMISLASVESLSHLQRHCHLHQCPFSSSSSLSVLIMVINCSPKQGMFQNKRLLLTLGKHWLVAGGEYLAVKAPVQLDLLRLANN